MVGSHCQKCLPPKSSNSMNCVDLDMLMDHAFSKDAKLTQWLAHRLLDERTELQALMLRHLDKRHQVLLNDFSTLAMDIDIQSSKRNACEEISGIFVEIPDESKNQEAPTRVQGNPGDAINSKPALAAGQGDAINSKAALTAGQVDEVDISDSWKVAPTQEKHKGAGSAAVVSFARSSTGKSAIFSDASHVADFSGKFTDLRTRLSQSGRHRSSSLRLRDYIHSSSFEMGSSVLIFLNSVMMALEMQYAGFNAGNQLLPTQYPRSVEEAWPSAQRALNATEVCFTVAFIVELCLRIYGNHIKAIVCPWIWFDTILLLPNLVQVAVGSRFLNLSMLRIIRIARLGRMLRLFRMFQLFDSLFLLVRSVHASVSALVWTFVFFLFVQVYVGMVLHQLLATFIEDASNDTAKRKLVFKHFGTYTKTMISMFKITFTNWAPFCRILMDTVSEWYGVFFIFYCCMICFAIMRVITAVFLTETNRILQSDVELNILKKQKEIEFKTRNLKELFTEMDTSGDGYLTQGELVHALDDTLVKTWMTQLEVEAHELRHMLDVIDDGDGKISIDEFLTGVKNLKTLAKSLDLAHVMKSVKHVDRQVAYILDKMGGMPS